MAVIEGDCKSRLQVTVIVDVAMEVIEGYFHILDEYSF